jgi:hypothetical protein
MLIAALFVIAKTRVLLGPSAQEWVNKPLYIQTLEYY